MTQTATLESVISHVHHQSINHYDEVLPLQEMEFDSLNQMWISGRRVEILPSAKRLIASRLRVPIAYLDRCSSSLQSENLNYWLKQEAKTRDSYFCRFDGDRLRGLFTNRYTVLDNMEVLSAMLEHGFSPEQEVQYSLDTEMMLVKVSHWEGAFNVASQDTMIPGISFLNGEVGAYAFCIEAFFWRCVCSNGMILPISGGHSRFKHISRKALDHFPDTVAKVLADSNRQRDEFVVSTQTPVEDPISTITSFNRRFGLTKDEGDAVLRAWELESGPNNMWSVINAYTASAKEPGLTAETAYRLEKVGGQILGMVRA